MNGLEIDIEEDDPIDLQVEDGKVVTLERSEKDIENFATDQIYPFFPTKGVNNKTIYKPSNFLLIKPKKAKKIDRIYTLRQKPMRKKINKKAIRLNHTVLSFQFIKIGWILIFIAM